VNDVFQLPGDTTMILPGWLVLVIGYALGAWAGYSWGRRDKPEPEEERDPADCADGGEK